MMEALEWCVETSLRLCLYVQCPKCCICPRLMGCQKVLWHDCFGVPIAVHRAWLSPSGDSEQLCTVMRAFEGQGP
jgi:hypothetical protein